MTAPISTLPDTSVEITRPYRRYALVLLMAIFALNLLDRQIVNILAESIKHEMHLADWQIGMMTGLTFALFYSTVGIPIARIAERGDRVALIALAIACWSGFTMLCGAARGFGQLLAFRVGVSVGEAGCTPAAHSLITEYTPPAGRASAMALYHAGVPIGLLLGMALGGVAADQFGWRVAFVIAGAPGIVLSALAFLTLREPRRGRARVHEVEGLSFLDAVRHLYAKPAFRLMCLGAAATAFVAYGQTAFVASFFLRAHGDALAAASAQLGLGRVGFLGLALGGITGLAGAAGTLLGGALGDRTARRDKGAYALIPALAALAWMPVAVVAMQAPSLPVALVAWGAATLCGTLWSAPVHAAILSIPPPHMRATASSLLLLTLNAVGLGFGPLFVGAASDLLAANGLSEADGLRWSLTLLNLAGLAAAGLFFAARAPLRKELTSQMGA